MLKNKGNILLPLISAVAVIGLIAAGYFYFQSQQNKQPVSTNGLSPTPTPTPIPTTQDEIANWKTYTSLNNNYSVKYPPNWTAKEITTSLPDEISPNTQINYLMLISSDNVNPNHLYIYTKPVSDGSRMTGRTGLGAGELKATSKVVDVMNIKLPVWELIDQGKVKEVFYSSDKGLNPEIVAKNKLYAEFGSENQFDYEKIDLTNNPDLELSDQILSTFKFL